MRVMKSPVGWVVGGDTRPALESCCCSRGRAEERARGGRREGRVCAQVRTRAQMPEVILQCFHRKKKKLIRLLLSLITSNSVVALFPSEE